MRNAASFQAAIILVALFFLPIYGCPEKIPETIKDAVEVEAGKLVEDTAKDLFTAADLGIDYDKAIAILQAAEIDFYSVMLENGTVEIAANIKVKVEDAVIYETDWVYLLFVDERLTSQSITSAVGEDESPTPPDPVEIILDDDNTD